MFKLGRNPFARETVSKEKVKDPSSGPNYILCSWCGGVDRMANVYRFYVETDSCYGVKAYLKGEFCSIQCARNYHNL